MSGVQFRHLMNNLGQLLPVPVHYLEIGVFAGSTLISLLSNNENVKTVVGVDLWDSANVLGGVDGLTSVKDKFLERLPHFTRSCQLIAIIEADCWLTSPNTILEKTGHQPINLYLFDGPHDEDDHYFALVNYFPALADTFIFLVDDWNVPSVRIGTEAGLAMLADELIVVGKIEILTDINPGFAKSLWHNGLAAFVISKRLNNDVKQRF